MDKQEQYSRIISHEGTTVTICANRFEIMTKPLGEVFEVEAVKLLKEWIRWRRQQEDLREGIAAPTMDLFSRPDEASGT